MHKNILQKRVVITLGDSRVGKSTCIKLLVDLLRCNNKQFLLYDLDKRNKFIGYRNYVPLCDNLNFFKGNTDVILDDIKDTDVSVILVDMPGQYITSIINEIEDCCLFEKLAELDWQITFLQPISHRNDCINYLKQIMNYADVNANYVVVKNLYFDKYFIKFEKEVVNKLHQLNGEIINLDQLQKNVYEVVDKFELPYKESCENVELFLLYRSYLFRWMKNFTQQIADNILAAKYLGIYSLS